MASSGKDKWKKYFSMGNVQTEIVVKKGQTSVDVFDMAGKKKIDTLTEGDKILVPRAKEYNSKYAIQYTKGGKKKVGRVSDTNVKKPIAKKGGATENLKIYSTTLIRLGKAEERKIGEKKVKCMVFYRLPELQKSILDGLKKNKNVSTDIYKVVEDFFRSGLNKINWKGDIQDSEVNELGKYLGELIIGALTLAGKTTSFNPNPFKKKAKSFIVPDDPSFAGIDSIVEMSNGELMPVSSKFGVGAKASIFANLLPKGMANIKNLRKSKFKELCAITLNNNLDPEKEGKIVVYMYGIRGILGLGPGTGKMKVQNVMSVYESIRKEDMNEDVVDVITAITREKPDQKVLDSLPQSVTAFFCRTIADELNKDKVAIEDMKAILSGKNFWQANLQINDWVKGTVNYKMVSSKNVDLKIIGSKSAITDITAKQGLVNYELRMG